MQRSTLAIALFGLMAAMMVTPVNANVYADDWTGWSCSSGTSSCDVYPGGHHYSDVAELGSGSVYVNGFGPHGSCFFPAVMPLALTGCFSSTPGSTFNVPYGGHIVVRVTTHGALTGANADTSTTFNF